MTVEETVFAVQHPRYLVEEYLRLITDFGLDKEHIYRRCEVGLPPCGRVFFSHTPNLPNPHTFLNNNHAAGFGIRDCLVSQSVGEREGLSTQRRSPE